MKIPKSFWGPKAGPRPHAENGSLRSHDTAVHRRQFRPVTIWGPPRSNPGSAPVIIIILINLNIRLIKKGKYFNGITLYLLTPKTNESFRKTLMYISVQTLHAREHILFICSHVLPAQKL